MKNEGRKTTFKFQINHQRKWYYKHSHFKIKAKS